MAPRHAASCAQWAGRGSRSIRFSRISAGKTPSGRLFERVTAGGVAGDRAKCGAMISSEVQRTLVKSPPELWAEISDPASLARHLGEFGEIRITRCLLYTSDAADEEDS